MFTQFKLVGQLNPPSPMEIAYQEEDYPDVPTVNKNQTGWYWFGSIVGKNPEPKLAMAEALDSLIGNFNSHTILFFFFFFMFCFASSDK